MKIIHYFVILFLIVACNPDKSEVIVIQPFGDFAKEDSKNVLQEIKKINPNTILRNNIPFPDEAYYKPRNRYKADLLLSYLEKMVGNDSVIIGLSLCDISTKKDSIEDWGVMGLGYRPGNACVVSSFRLAKANKAEQFYKVALHELGHTEGLQHCPVKSCLMRDAEGGNPLDEEKEFCNSCKAYLQTKNWKFL